MALAFVTLYARRLEETAALYRLLGLEFVEERHGSGPLHLAAMTSGLALEIYPGEEVDCAGLLLGFEVADLNDVREMLIAAGIRLHTDIAEPHGVRRLIALDADGRRVMVTQSAGTA
jgi:catechol 2,3-dioxygenase-like lactoylglutathione lyase family enzyme